MNETNMQIIEDLPFEDYLALDRLSSSGIKTLLRSPAHYQWARANPSQGTAAQQLGTLLHMRVLEPQRYATSVRVAPAVDRRTKAGKEAYEAFQGSMEDHHVLATDEQDKLVADMADRILSHRVASALLSDCRTELTVLWEEEGIPCKARFDALPAGHQVIVDLKTAQTADYEGFAKAAGNFGYHVQSAFYSMAARRAGLGDRPLVFVVIENTPPHEVALYHLDGPEVGAGANRVQHALSIYRECQASNQWPGYPVEIQALTLPKWAL